MKKLALSLVVGAALALTPLSSFALTAMSADTMKDATGQAGVSIVVDDVTLYQTVGETMYIDTDGINAVGGNEDAAAITISGKETFVTIRALLDHTNRGGFLSTAFASETGANGYSLILDGTKGNRDNFYKGADGEYLGKNIEIAAISIDVASKAPICSKIKGSDVAAVIIGLPTIEIKKTGDIQQIGITGCTDDGTYTAAAGSEKTFIQIEKTDSILTVMGGSLEIAAH